MLVSIYGSQDTFVAEVRLLLAERLLRWVGKGWGVGVGCGRGEGGAYTINHHHDRSTD